MLRPGLIPRPRGAQGGRVSRLGAIPTNPPPAPATGCPHAALGLADFLRNGLDIQTGDQSVLEAVRVADTAIREHGTSESPDDLMSLRFCEADRPSNTT